MNANEMANLALSTRTTTINGLLEFVHEKIKKAAKNGSYRVEHVFEFSGVRTVDDENAVINILLKEGFLITYNGRYCNVSWSNHMSQTPEEIEKANQERIAREKQEKANQERIAREKQEKANKAFHDEIRADYAMLKKFYPEIDRVINIDELLKMDVNTFKKAIREQLKGLNLGNLDAVLLVMDI